MCAQQIPLVYPVAPSMGAEDFMVTASNEVAVSQLAQSGSILLLGPKGSGKSHLARIWQAQRQAKSIRLPDISHEARAFALEDADRIEWDNATQQAAFHLLNIVKEKGLELLVTATLPPAGWSLTLADLKSRLLALPVAQIETPDDTLVAGLLLKHFRDRQLRVSEEVLNYLIARVARDGAAIEHTVKHLDELSLANNRAITIPLAGKLFGN